MSWIFKDRFKLLGDEIVSFAPLVIDQFLRGALKPSIVAPLMTAEQRLHQVTACHAMKILALCHRPRGGWTEWSQQIQRSAASR